MERIEVAENTDNGSQKGILAMSSPRDQSGAFWVALVATVLVVINIIITAIVLGRPVNVQYPAAAVAGGGDGKGTVGGSSSGGAGTVINVNGPPPAQGAAGGASGSAIGGSGDRTYLLAYGHDFGAYEYIDDGGYHRGFLRELMEEVCTAAGVKCKAVFDRYQNCWMSPPGEHPYLGLGLQDRYYDGWIGWSATIERIHTASFSVPFTPSPASHFYVKKGSTLNLENFTGRKLAFHAGYADNEKCLARELAKKQGIPLKPNQIFIGKDPSELFNLLDNGTVDAIFADKAAMGDYATDDKLTEIDASLTCVLSGSAVMSRADSEFPAIWNRGFEKILTNGQFKTLCENGADTHADKGKITCVNGFNFDV